MTELIWDGKYVDGKRQTPVRVALPFQTIETVNEAAADRQRSLELFARGGQSEWRNRLIWGDKKYVLPSLLPEFAGKVNLIYIDPPFDTGADFSFTATLPPKNNATHHEPVGFTKEPSIIEIKAYRDTWGAGLDSYLKWFWETVVLLHEFLVESGTIYVHLDWHVAHYAKAVLDEVFGSQAYRSEIIWQKLRSVKSQSSHFANMHDMIFVYSKTQTFVFNAQFVDKDPNLLNTHYRHTDPETGRRYNLDNFTQVGPGPARKFGDKWLTPPPGKHWIWSQERIDEAMKNGLIVFSSGGLPYVKRYFDDNEGTRVGDIWTDINPVNQVAKERVDYPTQKPEALLERIIEASSNENELVLDCFGGSGTTAAVSERLNRRWISCDLGRYAIHVTRKRLLSLAGVKAFIVQNLGKYERQVWQQTEFHDADGCAIKQQQEREAAYRQFVLELYHANPMSGFVWLHGIKAGRMVHVGAVDAPVTIADVKSIAREVWKAASGGANTGAAADILGWDFAFELNEIARDVAAQSRVRVSFKKIPHEVLERKAFEQGDVKFFELGALSVEPKQRGRELILRLTDFVIPTDDVPVDARKAIKHWSQMIDYWAVDWDFKDDTFHNQWQSYRVRKNPEIDLSAMYEYPGAGAYRVVVKVIDILGNDTTKTLEIKVK